MLYVDFNTIKALRLEYTTEGQASETIDIDRWGMFILIEAQMCKISTAFELSGDKVLQ